MRHGDHHRSTPPGVPPRRPRRRTRTNRALGHRLAHRRRRPLRLFYKFVLEACPAQVQDLRPPVAAAHRGQRGACVWVICAVGLNIVVGYAGLLDLGFVAFWAIGGYVAGWFMSPFFDQVATSHFLSAPRRRTAAGHPPQLLARAVDRRAVLRALGHHHRCADAAAQERLPGAGHARASARSSRRSSATVRTSTGSTCPTGPRASPRSTRSHRAVALPRACRSRSGPFDQDLQVPRLRAARRVRALRLAADPRGPARPGLAGDPRGRARREHDGRPADAHEARRLRRGRVHRWPRRCRSSPSTSTACSPDRFDFSISIILLAMVVLGGMGNVWGVMIGALSLAWINSTGLPQFGRRSTARSGPTSTSRPTTS